MSTQAKIGTMKIGQNVTIPTKAWGTWTGEIIATRELGPYAKEGEFLATIRDADGSETEVRTNRNWSGYINEDAPAPQPDCWVLGSFNDGWRADTIFPGTKDGELAAHRVAQRRGYGEVRPVTYGEEDALR